MMIPCIYSVPYWLGLTKRMVSFFLVRFGLLLHCWEAFFFFLFLFLFFPFLLAMCLYWLAGWLAGWLNHHGKGQ